jgi:peptidoglycan/xylan/chitin deacetylase (PgdA/CDA1 family)
MRRAWLVVLAIVALTTPGVLSVVVDAAAQPAEPLLQPLPQTAQPSSGPALAESPSPSPSPGDVTAPVTVATGSDARWHRSAVTVTLSATDDESGVAATWFKVDDGAWQTGVTVVVAAPQNHRGDGEHTVAFYSVDNAGNTEAPKSTTVKIDTTPPRFGWRRVSPAVIRSTRSVHFLFNVTEASGEVLVSAAVTDQYGSSAIRQGSWQRASGAQQITIVPRYKNHQPFMPGEYKVRLTLVDQAGNTAVSKPHAFRDFRPAAAKAWYHVSGAGKRMALSFDDSGDGPWASMLRTLKAYHSHATFFVLGPWINSALARKTIAGGNAIGSHGWTHTEMTRQSYGAVRSELTRTLAPWWRAAGATPVPYFRPPYGSFNSTTLAAAGSAGFTRAILWDVDPRDWTSPGSAAITQRVLSHVHSGAIVCMHLRPQTAAALPAILRGLHARGYKAVTIPELFRAAGYR